MPFLVRTKQPKTEHPVLASIINTMKPNAPTNTESAPPAQPTSTTPFSPAPIDCTHDPILCAHVLGWTKPLFVEALRLLDEYHNDPSVECANELLGRVNELTKLHK